MKRQSRREGEGGWGEETVHGRRESEEREAFRALLPPWFSFWHGSFCASLFCSSEIYRVEEMRRREESEVRERGREGERKDSSSFFWMSQAQVRRRGKDEQEAG